MAKPAPSKPATQIKPEPAAFSVIRLVDGRYQAQRVIGTSVTRISEPTVFEALAYRYLSGAVQDYWDQVCRDRARS